ncbi:MAG: RDD family protein [Actinobacteria bacterium]|nr:RDD family protein [Actinomycetota bacterium]
MDPEELREAQASLERDYLAGAFSADEYTRRRRELHASGLAQPAGGPVSDARLAGWGRRAAALVLDSLLIVVFIFVTSIWAFATADLAAGTLLLFVLFLFPWLYQWLMVGRWGQTLGKMALGTRVVRASDCGRVGYARAAGRAASVWVLGIFGLPLLLAYLWPLWDERNQTLYDKMAGTIVVRVR